MTVYKITPVAKPRMTRRDKWLNPPRPRVARYKTFKDLVRYTFFGQSRHAPPLSGKHIIFHIEMPKSWSKSKKERFDGKPHQSTPDLDNLLKALFDSLYIQDAHIWDIWATKLWARYGAIEITDVMNKERG